jgi:hypothetical protein
MTPPTERDESRAMTDPNWQLGLLVGSLKQMAMSANEQIESLPAFVNAPSEIVDDFYNAFLLVDQVIAAGLLDPSVRPVLERINSIIDDIQSRGAASQIWDRSALATNVLWESLRVEARDALRKIGA